MGLLEKDPQKRLGRGSDVRRHNFFEAVDWEKVERKGYEPEWKPEADPKANFDPSFTKQDVGLKSEEWVLIFPASF